MSKPCCRGGGREQQAGDGAGDESASRRLLLAHCSALRPPMACSPVLPTEGARLRAVPVVQQGLRRLLPRAHAVHGLGLPQGDARAERLHEHAVSLKSTGGVEQALVWLQRCCRDHGGRQGAGLAASPGALHAWVRAAGGRQECRCCRCCRGHAPPCQVMGCRCQDLMLLLLPIPPLLHRQHRQDGRAQGAVGRGRVAQAAGRSGLEAAAGRAVRASRASKSPHSYLVAA